MGKFLLKRMSCNQNSQEGKNGLIGGCFNQYDLFEGLV